MKQNLSQYFDLRSARDNNYDLASHRLSNNEHRGQLFTAVSEKILVGHTQQTSPDNNDRRNLYLDVLGSTEQKEELSGSKLFTLTRLSGNNTDHQPINQFLTSDGGESERNIYDNMIQSTEGRGPNHYTRDSNGGNAIMFTNQTTSSMKNVPMSYSSTNSRGYLDTRFKRLHDISSPIQEQTTIQREQRNPRFSEFSGGNIQSSNKKSVKFLDEHQTESKYSNNYQNNNLRLGNHLQYYGGNGTNGNSQLNDNQNDTSNMMSISENNFQYTNNFQDNQTDGDTSQIIQAHIDVKMNEINSKYFSNESSQNRIITSARVNSNNGNGSRDRVIKPIIKSIDTTTVKSQNLIESLTPLSDTKRDPLNLADDDDDKNSLVAMEEAIEIEKSRVHNKIERQFFSNKSGEPSIVVKNRPDNKQSVFTSTNSFEKLRDEILNNQSYSKPALDSEFGTQNRSLQMILGDGFNKNERSYEFTKNVDNGQTQQEWTLNNQTQNQTSSQLYQDTLKSEINGTMESIKNYIPLRKSRERKNEEDKNFDQRDHSANFRDNLMNQNKEYENKLQNLKSKISNIHRQNSQQNILSADISRQELSQNLNTIIATPTVRDLNSNQLRSFDNLRNQSQDNDKRGNNLIQNQQQQQLYTQDILILNPHDYQTNNSSREASSYRNSSKSRDEVGNNTNMNTKDLRSKIMELKQSISDNEEEEGQNSRSIQEISNKVSSNKENKYNHQFTSQSRNNHHISSRNSSSRKSYQGGPINITTTYGNQTNSSLRKIATKVSDKKESKTTLNVNIAPLQETRIRPLRSNSNTNSNKQENETVQNLKKKVKWLERRNMEYSQRLRDLNSQKNDAQIQIIELQRQVKEMGSKFRYQQNDMKSAHNIENMKIGQLQQQVQELQQIIKQQQFLSLPKQMKDLQIEQNKENFQLNQTSENITSLTIDQQQDTSTSRLQALQVHHMKMPRQRAPQVPLRYNHATFDSREPKNDNISLTVRERSRSASKPKQLFTNVRIRSASKECQNQKQQQPLVKKVKKVKKNSRSRSKDKKKLPKSKSKDREIINRLTNQVVELSQMINKVQAKQNENKQLQDKFGILQILQEKLLGLNDECQAQSIKEKLLKVFTDSKNEDEACKENRIINPFKENKYKRDKSN